MNRRKRNRRIAMWRMWSDWKFWRKVTVYKLAVCRGVFVNPPKESAK